MEVSSSNIKKIFIFSQKKAFSYISGNETLHLSAQAQRIKKSTPRKFVLLEETETLKTPLIFSSKKAVFMFREKRTPKKFFIFQETELSELEK